MILEDGSEREYIIELIRDEFMFAQRGVVTKVYEHTSSDDKSNFEVTVETASDTHPRVPVGLPMANTVAPPRVDDVVVLTFLDGSGKRPIVSNVLYDTEKRAMLGKAGVIRQNRGDLYNEMAPDGSWGRIVKKSKSDGTPEMGVQVHVGNDTVKATNSDGYGIEVAADGTLKLYGTHIETRTDGSTLSWP